MCRKPLDASTFPPPENVRIWLLFAMNHHDPLPEPETALTLGEAQASVDRWIKTYGVRYFSELTNLAQLVEEVGELSRIISRRYGDQSFKADGSEPSDLEDELSDVLFVLICLANQTGVDLTAGLRRNLDKKTRRDARRHQDNPKLD